jgi:cation transport ATPase
MREARIRILCTFVLSVLGELVSLAGPHGRLYWIIASVVTAIFLAQLWSDSRNGDLTSVFLQLPAAAAALVLYCLCSARALAPTADAGASAAGGAGHYAHMVYVTTVFLLIARYFTRSAQLAAAEAMAGLDAAAGEPGEYSAGGVVTVPRGGIVPVDGRLVSGETSADESILTGDITRVTKRAGDTLYCGGVNYDRAVEIEALCSREECVYPRLLAAARRSLSGEQGGLRLRAQRVGIYLVPLVFLAAAAVVAITAVSGGDVRSAAMRAISAAVAVSPSALAIFSPIADTVGFAALAALGILTSVYAGMAASACALGIAVHNGHFEKSCRAITFEKLLSV